MSTFSAGSIVGTLELDKKSLNSTLSAAVADTQKASKQLGDALAKPFAPAAAQAATLTGQMGGLVNSVGGLEKIFAKVEPAAKAVDNATASLGTTLTQASTSATQLASTTSATSQATQTLAESNTVAAAAATKLAAAETEAATATAAAGTAASGTAAATASAGNSAGLFDRLVGGGQGIKGLLQSLGKIALVTQAVSVGVDAISTAYVGYTGTAEQAAKAGLAWIETLKSIPIVGGAVSSAVNKYRLFGAKIFGRQTSEEVLKDIADAEQWVKSFRDIASDLQAITESASRGAALAGASDAGGQALQDANERSDALAKLAAQKRAIYDAQKALGTIGSNKGADSDDYKNLAADIERRTREVEEARLSIEQQFQAKRLKSLTDYLSATDAAQAQAQDQYQVKALRANGQVLEADLAQLKNALKLRLEEIDKAAQAEIDRLGPNAAPNLILQVKTAANDQKQSERLSSQVDQDAAVKSDREANEKKTQDAITSAAAAGVKDRVESLRAAGKNIEADLLDLQKRVAAEVDAARDKADPKEDTAVASRAADLAAAGKTDEAQQLLARMEQRKSIVAAGLSDELLIRKRYADEAKALEQQLADEEAGLRAAQLRESGQGAAADLVEFDRQWQKRIAAARKGQEQITLQATYESERRRKVQEQETDAADRASQLSAARLRESGQAFAADLLLFDAEWKHKIATAAKGEAQNTLIATYESERRLKIRQHEADQAKELQDRLSDSVKGAESLRGKQRDAFYADFAKVTASLDLGKATRPITPAADPLPPNTPSPAAPPPPPAPGTGGSSGGGVSSMVDAGNAILQRIADTVKSLQASVGSIDRNTAQPQFKVVNI